MKEWRVYSKKADFAAVGDRYNIDPVIARIIRNRNVENMDDINRYLTGSMNDLSDAHLMKDMDEAVRLMVQAISSHKKIRIIGDYDIDGICSIYILFKGLLRAGANVDYDIPDRIEDGYGINEKLIERAHEDGCQVIITCDNGIAAISQTEYAKALGMTVIITDHHDVQYDEADGVRTYRYPCADAVVDPKQPDCKYPFKLMCGAGIAYRYVCLLYEQYNIPIMETEEMLGFAAFATIGDIVDLQGENRIIVREGLEILRHTRNKGLNELINVTGINKENLTAYHIGFVLGPCFNASGRLDSAKRTLRMLLSEDEITARKYAIELNELNLQRKELTAKAEEKAIEIVENTYMDSKVLVIYIPDCHESIAGIVAGRIRERYYKPVIILTDAKDGVKGSARSIESYNIFEKLSECRHLLTKFGGHPMAAGLSLEKENVDELRKYLNENSNLSEEDLTQVIWIDVPMPINYVREEIIEQLKLLEPFGKANEKPVFADKNLMVRSVKPIGKKQQYTKLVLQDVNGVCVDAVVFFRADELIMAYNEKKYVSCIYYPEINQYNGKRTIQICVTSYKVQEDIK